MSSDEVVTEPAGYDGADDPDDPGVRSGEYRVEVLSALTGLTVRTIREYQAGGLLPGPRKVGRHAYYNEDHLLRLQLIERLQQRGYANAGIRDLLEAWSSGQNLGEVLGLDIVVSEPWTTETPVTLTARDLQAMFRGQFTADAADRATGLGILEPAGAGEFSAPNPSMLAAGRDLVDTGIPLARVLEVIAQVRTELDDPADRLIGLVWDHVFPQDETARLPEGVELQTLAQTISTLRPHALRTVDTLFAGSMVRAINRRYQQVTDRIRAAEVPAGREGL